MNLKGAAILFGVILILIAGGFALGWHTKGVRAQAELAKVLNRNEELKESERAALVQAGQFDQTAKDSEARALDEKSAKDAASAEVARLKARLAQITGSPLAPLPGLPVVSGSGSDTEVVVLRQLAAAQDVRYDTQGKQLIATEQARDAYKAETASLKSALGKADARAGILETQLRSMAKGRNWAAGAVYGSDGQIGATLERDLGPVRIGADVVRHRLPGGNQTYEAVARVLWRF